MLKSEKGVTHLLLLMALVGILAFLLISNIVSFNGGIFSRLFPKPSSHAVGGSVVILQGGKIYLNGALFNIHGINYVPTYIGSDQTDLNASTYDVPKMAMMGANTIGTYNAGYFDWGTTYTNISSGQTFYNNLYPVAESNHMMIIVGYFSNASVDWTSSTEVSRLTTQYQNMVLNSKDHPSTLMYMIGNEIFEKLANNTQRIAYAQWIGQMVNWTHQKDPNHPVTYAADSINDGLSLLKTYAPGLDIYSINTYDWNTSSDLANILTNLTTLWPGKPILLHEWGTDSLNVSTGLEDTTAQANRLAQLIPEVEQNYNNPSIPLLGSLIFEFTDQWEKVGSASVQDVDAGGNWSCRTCFDAKANEDWWGVARSTSNGGANSRALKPAYQVIQQFWATLNTSSSALPVASVTPSPTPSSSASPIRTPKPTKGPKK